MNVQAYTVLYTTGDFPQSHMPSPCFLPTGSKIEHQCCPCYSMNTDVSWIDGKYPSKTSQVRCRSPNSDCWEGAKSGLRISRNKTLRWRDNGHRGLAWQCVFDYCLLQQWKLCIFIKKREREREGFNMERM